MARAETTAVVTKDGDFKQIFNKTVAVSLAIAIGLAVLFAGVAIMLIVWAEYSNDLANLIAGTPRNEKVVYVVSWLILLLISLLATLQVHEIIEEQSQDIFRKRASYIAIMIALVLLIFLFEQPYLEMLFQSGDTAFWIRSVLFAGGAGGGWVVWYLRQLEKYGEFFNVFLFTTVTGFCWYARLTAPEEIQLTAVAFLLGSLFRVAKDYLDRPFEKGRMATPT